MFKLLAIAALALASNLSFAADFVQSEYLFNFRHINAREGTSTENTYKGEVRFDRQGAYCEVFYRTIPYACTRQTDTDGTILLSVSKADLIAIVREMVAEDYPRMFEILQMGYTGQGEFQFPHIKPNYVSGVFFTEFRSYQDPRSNFEELRIEVNVSVPHYF